MRDRKALSIKWVDEKLWILDQQLLPHQETWIEVASPDHMVDIIRALKVRGAPLIGVCGVMALASWVDESSNLEDFKAQCEKIRAARPTAVDVMNLVDRLWNSAMQEGLDREVIVSEALKIFDENIEACKAMSQAAAKLINSGDQILTHCNTGGLATPGMGTALGAIIEAHQQGKDIHVFVDETRPLIQGGRLTTWELKKAKVPYTQIC